VNGSRTPTVDPPARGFPRSADGDGRPGRPRDEQVTLAILAAARRQAAELGYANVSMESVAAEAGVARATVYRRFSDKADLVTAAVAADEGAPAGDPATVADPRAALVRFMGEFDRRFGEHCLEIIGGLLGSRERPDAMRLHRERVVGPRFAAARGLLERSRDLGLVAADADLDLALQLLAGAVFARRIQGIDPEPGWARRAVDAVFAAMAAPPVTPR
jgi:AcrR family transcriptional regulator